MLHSGCGRAREESLVGDPGVGVAEVDALPPDTLLVDRWRCASGEGGPRSAGAGGCSSSTGMSARMGEDGDLEAAVAPGPVRAPQM